jgi:hypothetical protein
MVILWYYLLLTQQEGKKGIHCGGDLCLFIVGAKIAKILQISKLFTKKHAHACVCEKSKIFTYSKLKLRDENLLEGMQIILFIENQHRFLVIY